MLSAAVYERSLAFRVQLNRAVLTNKYWCLPVDDVGHEDFEPVGRGAKSSVVCGQWRNDKVCKNVEAHKGVVVHGVDCSGKVVVAHKHWWCHKPTCPVCFARGWSVRGARNIEARLEVGVRRGFGKVEHVSVSVPTEHRGLSEKVLREKCSLALLDRGVVGNCMIFHGYRIDRTRDVLVWSPHYHTLGFIDGGFDRCRDCVHGFGDCATCSGFKGREVRGFAKDRYLVKVHGERKTVFGSAWYELNHATVRVSAFKRFHVVTWWGVCANRKYSSAAFVLPVEDACPACGDDMERCVYRGKRFIPRDVGHVDYKPWYVDDEYGEDGEPNYPELVGSRGSVSDRGSGNFEVCE